MAQLCIAQFKGAFIADIVFFLLIFIFAIVDAHKGFISCFFSIVSTIVAVLVALFFASGFLSLTGGLFGLQGVIGGGIGNALSGVEAFNIDISTGNIQAVVAAAPLPQFIKDAILAVATAGGEVPAGTTLAMQAGNVIAQFIVTLVCAVVLFFLVKLIMFLLKGLFENLVEKMEGLRKLNRILGMVVGILTALGITCLVLAILGLFPSEGLTAFFNDTILLSGLYHHNPIYGIFSWFF